MSTELDIAKMMWGWGAGGGGSSSNRPGTSYGAQTSTRYGTVQSVNEDGTVTILLDTGETVTLKTDTPLSVGDRVVIVVQGSTYLVYAMKGMLDKLAQQRTELAQQIKDEGDAIRDEVDQEMEDFKADHQLTDADITSSIEQSKSDITATFEGQISAVEDDIEKNYATKTEVSTGINGLRTEVSETYATSEGVTDEINSAITQASGSISSEVEQNVMNAVGDTYATKTELEQTSDELSLTIRSSIANAYGTCSTSASSATKVVSTNLSNFTLKQGMTIAVKFTYANTNNSPYLNVDGTGANSIYLGNSPLTAEDSWDAGDTVTFVYDGSRWNIADPSLKDAKTVASYFIADSTGLTVGQESQDAAVRMSSGGSFDVLNNSEVLFSISSEYQGVNEGYYTSLSADAWDGIVIETAGSSRMTITRGGYGFSSMEGGFGVNGVRGLETYQYTPTTQYGSFTVNMGGVHVSSYNMQFVNFYWHNMYDDNRGCLRVHIARGETKYATMDSVRWWADNVTICMQMLGVIVSSNGYTIQVNRGDTGRISVGKDNVNNFNPSPGDMFVIDRVTVCS